MMLQAYRRTAIVAALVASLPAITYAQSTSAPVHVAEVVEQKVASTVELVGTVMPLRRSVVASGAEGLVVDYQVREGDRVEQDQVLAQLRVRTLRIEESAAAAALKEAQEQLRELQSGARPEELDQARGAVGVAEARAQMARAKQQRLERLLARNAASGEDVDESVGLSNMANQELAQLRAQYDLIQAGAREEKVKQVEARVEAARAELDRVQDEIDKRTVRAPFAGYIVAELTQVGQWLSPNSPVVELVDLEQVEVLVMVPERHMSELRVGKKAAVRIDAIDGRTFDGTVSRVVRQADTKSRLFPVRILLANPVDEHGQPLIHAGMFALARLPLGARHLARLVPKDALVLQAGTSVVYVVEPNGAGHRVAAVPVKPGSAHEGLVEVEGNLKSGQLVVVRGNERLAHGQAVQLESRVDRNGTAPAERDKVPGGPR